MNSGICISETHRDVANRTTRSAGFTTGPSWSVVASIRRQSSAGSLSVMRRHPVDATRRGAPSCRSRRVLATGAARGMWASRLRPVERAAASIAAAGAMRSCVHPSCEVSIPGTRSPVQVSIPGGHVATVRQRLRPMSPALGRDQWQPTGDCRDHRRALHRSRICWAQSAHRPGLQTRPSLQTGVASRPFCTQCLSLQI